MFSLAGRSRPLWGLWFQRLCALLADLIRNRGAPEARRKTACAAAWSKLGCFCSMTGSVCLGHQGISKVLHAISRKSRNFHSLTVDELPVLGAQHAEKGVPQILGCLR